MSDATYPINPESLLLDTKTAREIGTGFAQSYQSGQPYHHICIEKVKHGNSAWA